jgi:hypothetical protein
MSGSVDEAVCEQARQAMAAARRAEHAVLESVRALAAALIAKLDTDGIAPDDDSEPTDELRIVRRKDGTLALKGRFRGRADIELLCETFDALSGRANAEDHRDLAQRYAETLLDLCGHAGATGGITTETGPDTRVDPDDTCGPIERGEPDPRHQPRTAPADQHDDGSDDAIVCGDASTDSAPASDSGAAPAALRRRAPRAPGRAQLTPTMPLSWLQNQIGHGLLADETPISAAETRRLACDAAIIPTLLGTRSEPLDVGRLSYTVPEPIRRALVFRDRGCSFPGCRRRPGRCHAHHVDHWADGGPTALDNLTLLCRFHHVRHEARSLPDGGGRPPAVACRSKTLKLRAA